MEPVIISPILYGCKAFYYNRDIKEKKTFLSGQRKCHLFGFASRGEKSRHINIGFFFIKDVLQNINIKLAHCPTNKMVADYFTKPLQGGLFVKIRNQIMGVSDITVEERVGDQSENEELSKKLATEISKCEKNKRTVAYAEAVTQVRRINSYSFSKW